MSLIRDLRTLKRLAQNIPEEKDTQAALKMVAQGAPYDQLFFIGLEDPAWLPVLENEGYFTPTSQDTNSPYARLSDKRLPFITLVKLAPTESVAVARVLSRVTPPNESEITDLIMRGMSLINDRASIALLDPVLSQLVASPEKSSWLWGMELLKNWIDQEAFGPALKLTQAFLNHTIAQGERGIRGTGSWMLKEIDRVLERLMEVRPFELSLLLSDALSRLHPDQNQMQACYETSLKHEEALRKLSRHGWHDKDETDDTGNANAEFVLAQRLYKSCSAVYHADVNKSAKLDSVLKNNSSETIQRLRWQLYGDLATLTLEKARRETLEKIPAMASSSYSHQPEFSHMLKCHAQEHGQNFLSSEEVLGIISAVKHASLSLKANSTTDDTKNFIKRRLKPLAVLLKSYPEATLCEEDHSSTNVTPAGHENVWSSDVMEIEEIPPISLDEMASMGYEELFTFLNNWVPPSQSDQPERWITKTRRALASEFIKFVENSSDQFTPNKCWWEKLSHPVFSAVLFERALGRIQEITSDKASKPPLTAVEWKTWFGALNNKTLKLQQESSEQLVEEFHQNHDPLSVEWTNAFLSMVRFLNALPLNSVPTEYFTLIPDLLQRFFKYPDPWLHRESRTKVGDWLTVGINSVRGVATECVLSLAVQEWNTKHSVSPWTSELIFSELSHAGESPAIYAILGSKLRLLAYLFPEKVQVQGCAFFTTQPQDLIESLTAGHFLYDSPMVELLKFFPNLLELGFQTYTKLLGESSREENSSGMRDFGTQLGTHIAFYYWHGALGTKEEAGEILKRFYDLAPEETAANVIGKIAWIFRNIVASEENRKILENLQNLWENRFSQIENSERSGGAERNRELSRFTEWMACEGLDFYWRVDYCSRAIRKLKRAPQSSSILRALSKSSSNPERITAVVELLHAFLDKVSKDQIWSTLEEEIRPILNRGLASSDQRTRELTNDCVEILLRQGRFEFLEIGESLSG